MRRAIVVATAVSAAVALMGCSSSGEDGGGGSASATTATAAAPVDYADRGPYAVGQIDLELDADHRIAVFYPVDRDAVPEDADPYTYSGEDILGPEIVDLLPGALAGEITPPDTWLDVPASPDGPFPVVMHSHGAAGNLRFANLHNSHVASWGYVVAAVDHPERGVGAAITASIGGGGASSASHDPFLDSDQLTAGLDLVLEEGTTDGSVLEGTVDESRVAAEGHSAGASAAGTLAYDDRVDLWIGEAPSAPLEPGTDVDPYVSENEDGRPQLDTEALLADTSPPPVPSLILAAEGDTVIPLDRVEAVYGWLDAPKRLVVIADSGHAVFVDPCQPIQAEGGLAGFVEGLGLDPDEVPLVELGENGCLPDDTPAETVWALIDHVTVAQLNSVFGVDAAAAEASLTPEYLATSFPDRFLREDSER